MHIMRWEEVRYGILDYESKLLQIETSTFPWVRGLHGFNFLKIYIYVKVNELPGKSYWKKPLENICINIINWEKLFDRSSDHK